MRPDYKDHYRATAVGYILSFAARLSIVDDYAHDAVLLMDRAMSTCMQVTTTCLSFLHHGLDKVFRRALGKGCPMPHFCALRRLTATCWAVSCKASHSCLCCCEGPCLPDPTDCSQGAITQLAKVDYAQACTKSAPRSRDL